MKHILVGQPARAGLVLVAMSGVAHAEPASDAPLPGSELTVAPAASESEATRGPSMLPELLPIEITAFGDFLYRISNREADRFEVGPVEIDVALGLAHNVTVSTGFVYDPAEDVVRLGSFTVDGGLLGDASSHLFESSVLDASGVIFGKFDVPFGIAYLKYPSTANRFVILPAPVLAVHDAWNDIGVQGYAIASRFNATAYWVNGFELEEGVNAPEFAAGGRVGVLPFDVLELGASAARMHAPEAGYWLYGADLALRTEPLELEGEYLARDPADGVKVHGFYAQAVGHVAAILAMARYEEVYAGDTTTDRFVTGGLGVELLPDAEVRLVHSHGVETDDRITFVQVVGGSAWQPTGLRR